MAYSDTNFPAFGKVFSTAIPALVAQRYKHSINVGVGCIPTDWYRVEFKNNIRMTKSD